MKGFYRQGFLVVAAAAAMLGGCATTSSSNHGGDPDLLTRDQIMSVEGVTTLYDVVQRLRPRWLVMRAEDRSLNMSTQIAVFQNQTYMGDIDTLRQFQPGMAFQLKYLNGTTAQNTLAGVPAGTHLSGAIIVSTRAPGGGGSR